MRIRFLTLLLLALWSLAGWSQAVAKAAETPLEALQPDRRQRQAALIITKVVGKYHYKDAPLDDRLSEEIFKRYLEALDPNRSYFTQREIDGFGKYRTRFDDALRQADLDAAFEIFRAYRQRVERQMELALQLLKANDFDFTQDEEYLFDRAKAPWPADEAELRELWRKRVKNDILGLRLADKSPDKILETLVKRYEGTIRRTRQLDANDVFQTFINAYTLSLEPHTSYMPPRLAENFDIGMRLSLEGIGAVLSLDNEYTTVQKVLAGGPAGQSGEVHAGDRIVGVAQDKGEMTDVVGWRLDDVVDLIRGPKGSTVRLRILPKDAGADGPARLVTLVRNEIKLEDQAAKGFVIEDVEGVKPWRIGVIDLPTFYHDFQGQSRGDKDFRSTTRDVRELLLDLQKQGVDGIVIDLRGNGGGALSEATELTGLFIKTGPVVQVKKADGALEVEKDNDPEVVYSGPLAVLVDRDSASASEIFAGAIQDYGRGLIIGEPTFGKGTVQTLIDLNRFVFKQQEDLGRLRLTMAQFFRVEGGSTQYQGVIPDIVFPTAKGAEKEGERSLDNALPWARIDAVAHATGKLGVLDAIRAANQKRVAADAGFQYLLEEEELRAEIRDRKTVSLNEAKRREEWKQREAQRKQETNRFRAAMGLPPAKEKPADEDEDKAAIPDEEDEEVKLIKRIAVNEAARILADYVAGQQPKAAMAR